jgi:hypothetical protein
MDRAGEQDLVEGILDLRETESWPGTYWVIFELGDRRHVVARRTRPRDGWERLERVFVDVGARSMARRRVGETYGPDLVGFLGGSDARTPFAMRSADDWVLRSRCQKALETCLSAASAEESAARFASEMGSRPDDRVTDAFERVYRPAARATEDEMHAAAAMLEAELLERFHAYAGEIERARHPIPVPSP